MRIKKKFKKGDSNFDSEENEEDYSGSKGSKYVGGDKLPLLNQNNKN